ncbi:hypothetical protein PHJA_002137100 [Phtheirospermum japonicum]|uniref:Uncharacterized protein n=1 Tax=Phtheirospermum japonicum TaxID=374723 RepID=A0A830CJG4_9LAMI|nr:hypothetical protein PHJA_002137100 [Phtheirospermum japonicum]
MSRTSVRKQSKFAKYIYVPIRVLARARDFYMKSLTGFGGPVAYGNAMGCPTPNMASISRSFSVNSNQKTAEEELRDLIRVGSARRHEEAELRRSKSAQPFGGRGPVVASVARSNTVAFERIDEDKIFEYGEEDDVGLLSRSRSYAGQRRIKLA